MQARRTFRTTCKMQQKNVKQFWYISLKLAVCPKTIARSQIRIKKECFFVPNLPKNGFMGRKFENLTTNLE